MTSKPDLTNKEKFNLDWNTDIDNLTEQQAKEMLILVHSWVKHHQGSLTRYSYKYQELLNQNELLKDQINKFEKSKNNN